jgi:hypothetical protein
MRPKYTVFLPAYRADIFIDNFCDNILRQLEAPDQVIIVDDTKNSKKFFNKIKNIISRENKIDLTFVKNTKRLKPAKSWNKYLKLFRNKLVFRMDADDIWKKNHTKKMIDEYLLDKDNLLYLQKNESSAFGKLFYNYDFLFTNQGIHSSCLFNLNKRDFFYPSTDQPVDDLKAYIKIKYLLKEKIKFVNFITCTVQTEFGGRFSNEGNKYRKKAYIKKLFFLALKKKMNIKTVNLISLIKILINYNILKTMFIFYKINQN